MIRIDYNNMPNGASKWNFTLRYLFNMLRSWYIFHVKYPWVKYHGFVRVMKGTRFAQNMDVLIGDNVQFGNDCNVASNVHLGNNVLMAGNVQFVGKHDHTFSVPGVTIWDGERGDNGTTLVGDDVWIGTSSIIISGVTIGMGSIVAAGSIVTCDVPPCEIWAGVPAKKLKDRFASEADKRKHLEYLESLHLISDKNRDKDRMCCLSKNMEEET